jgi:hypothetical protein
VLSSRSTILALCVTGVVAGLLCAAPVGGAAVQGRPTAAAFLERFLNARFFSDTQTEWQLMHPGQRAAVNRKLFMRRWAGPDASKSARWRWQFLAERSDPVLLINVPQHTSTEVALRATFYIRSRTVTRVYDKHAVWVGSRWAWILSPAEYDSFTHGRCPTY